MGLESVNPPMGPFGRSGGDGVTLVGALVGAFRKRNPGNPQKTGKNYKKIQMAESVGFEPTVRFHVHTLSKRAP